MTKIRDEVVHANQRYADAFGDKAKLAQSLATASFDGARWSDPGGGDGSRAGDFIDWLTISDLAESVVIDVDRIRTHPLVPRSIPIHGYIYEVTTGRLVEVPRATERGLAIG